MILYKSWLLPAIYTITLVVTTYVTSTEAAKQKQAEVDSQQPATVAVAVPSRPLKYGDKTTKKIPNVEVPLLPTSPTTTKNNVNTVIPRTGPRSRIEHLEASTNIPAIKTHRRYNSGPPQNQLVVQYDVPIVQKSRELFNKPTTTTVGHHNQQQQMQRIRQKSNRSRSQNTIAQTHQQQQQLQLQMRQQPTQYSNLNFQSKKNVAKTKTSPTIATQTNHQHKTTAFTTTSRIVTVIPSTNNNYPPPLKLRYANNTSSTFVTHQQNRNNTNNTYRVAASGDLQSKPMVTSSNKQRGNIKAKQNIGSRTASIRTNTRRFPSRPILTATSTISPKSRFITTTTTTTTTTPRPSPFQFPFNFNIFTSEFWQFLNPFPSPPPQISKTAPITKRPPKKYIPPTQITTKEEKLNLVKSKQKIPSRTIIKQPESTNDTNILPAKRDDGPFRIALPTLNILTSKREIADDGEKVKNNVSKEINLRERFDCPRESEVRFQLFPKICKIDEDCKVWNRDEICCEIFGAKSCVSGIPKPLEETSHSPILGLIPRKCPSHPLAELWWEVKECETDMDCWPRVCCPDGRRRYCRTSQPELSTVPVPVKRSFNYLSEYLECTPPPPAIFDLHPKACTSTLDCFPNVCCQEAGLRHCRPPKKSVLTMLESMFNVDFIKRLTQNIVIK